MFFFFKQKTAYEILSGLVGSEMCIRDRYIGLPKHLADPFGSLFSSSSLFTRKIAAITAANWQPLCWPPYLLCNVYSCQDRASRRAFFYADNPNYSYHSAPSILIPELWLKKRTLSITQLVGQKKAMINSAEKVFIWE